MPSRVLLVDDHPLFRAGVVAALNHEPAVQICAQTGQPAEALQLAAEHRPDTAIVDLMLQDGDGLRLVRDLRRDHPALRIIVLSMLDPDVYRPRALQAGADVFVSKQSGPDAVVAALQGQSAEPAAGPARRPGLQLLSERELQVFRELGLGRSSQETAAILGISVKTVESHRENIKAKLELPHANALVARAALWVREQGLSC